MSHPTRFPCASIDHVRFFVGNARQSAYFYRNAFGFDVVAYAGLETEGQARGRLRPAAGRHHFVLTSPLRADAPRQRSGSMLARRRRAGHRPRGGRRARRPTTTRSRAAPSA